MLPVVCRFRTTTAAVIAAVGFCLGATGAGAAAPEVTSETFDDWSARCAAGGRCEMATSLTVPGATEGTEAAAVINLRSPNPDVYVLTLRLPVKVWLPHGVLLSDAGEDKVARLRYLVCSEQGCDAGAELSGAQLAAWRDAGDRASLTYQQASGQRVKVTFSMAGFPAAANRLERR